MQSGVIELGLTEEPKSWEDSAAPLVLSGPRLEEIQTSLRRRASDGALAQPVKVA
jgi:hypothetical protein